MAKKDFNPITPENEESLRLRTAISELGSDLLHLPSGILIWRKEENEELIFLYDPDKITVEFFVGGGSTLYSSDNEQVQRVVIDSAFSKAQMKRANKSPYYSGRYAYEWHGETKPKEVPFPHYSDYKCVLGYIHNDSLTIPDKAIVPLLEKTANMGGITFVGSTVKPKQDKKLRRVLSSLLPDGSLDKVMDKLLVAYDLRQEDGPQKPYSGLSLFG